MTTSAPAAPVGEVSSVQRGSRRRLSIRWLTGLVIGLAALGPRLLTVGHFQTVDETLWMQRSVNFGNALRDLRLADASATTDALATMPGVTTMWLGTAARVMWAVARSIGLIDDGRRFQESGAAIALAQSSVAVVTALLIALIVALAWTWVGPVGAATAGALLATEPFLVAHGSVLHTDELTQLFGVAGLLALVVALDVPMISTSAKGSRWRMSAGAGALMALALLTKLSALGLLLAGAVPVCWAIIRSVRSDCAATSDERWRALRRTSVSLGQASLAGLVVVILLWPAIWADPARQIALLRDSAELASTGHIQFFRGRITPTPGPEYYLIAVPLRMTPWFLSAALLSFPLIAAGRNVRGRGVVLVLMTLPQIAVISLASKQFDRYSLGVVAMLALMVGLAAQSLWSSRNDRAPSRRTITLGCAAGALLVVHALVVAPFGLAYFNPALGGSTAAERNLLVGWGEGLEQAGRLIQQREGSTCDVVIAVNYASLQSSFPCGTLVYPNAAADYRVLYVNERQRLPPEEVTRIRSTGTLVGTVVIRGIDYAEVFDLRDPSPAHEEAAP